MYLHLYCFFFKQKTAYEMRISDWSSDVCSSDLLEKSALTEGATWHAAGLVGQLRSSRNTTRMLQRSVELYERLEAETGQAIDWKQVGSLRLACSPDRLLEVKRLATMARSFGLEMQVIGRSEEHTSELQSLMRISYAVFCLKKKKNQKIQ